MIIVTCDGCGEELTMREGVLHVEAQELSFLPGRRSERVHDERGERGATLYVCGKCRAKQLPFGNMVRDAIERAATSPPRCSMCLGRRAIINGRPTVCTFIGCEDPMRDWRRENPGWSAEPNPA